MDAAIHNATSRAWKRNSLFWEVILPIRSTLERLTEHSFPGGIFLSRKNAEKLYHIFGPEILDHWSKNLTRKYGSWSCFDQAPMLSRQHWNAWKMAAESCFMEDRKVTLDVGKLRKKVWDHMLWGSWCKDTCEREGSGWKWHSTMKGTSRTVTATLCGTRHVISGNQAKSQALVCRIRGKPSHQLSRSRSKDDWETGHLVH